MRYLRVVGRASADVIKPRGFKVSGLDVEAALLELRAAAAPAASPAPGGVGGVGVGVGGNGGADSAAAFVSPPSSGPAVVAECAVFGVPDGRYEGEEVVAALVRLAPAAAASSSAASSSASSSAAEEDKERSGDRDDAASARAHAAELARGAAALLPPYAVPRVWRFSRGPIPRNAMGKVNKRALRAALFPAAATGAPDALPDADARWVGDGDLGG